MANLFTSVFARTHVVPRSVFPLSAAVVVDLLATRFVRRLQFGINEFVRIRSGSIMRKCLNHL